LGFKYVIQITFKMYIADKIIRTQTILSVLTGENDDGPHSG